MENECSRVSKYHIVLIKASVEAEEQQCLHKNDGSQTNKMTIKLHKLKNKMMLSLNSHLVPMSQTP